MGAVHIAQPLAAMGLLLGYDVKIVDPREAFNTHERFPRTERIVQWPDKAFDEVTLHAQTALVALSHAPRLDDPALMAALDSDAFYIGALGSKTTHASRLARLTGAGYSPEALARIHGPGGVGHREQDPRGDRPVRHGGDHPGPQGPRAQAGRGRAAPPGPIEPTPSRASRPPPRAPRAVSAISSTDPGVVRA